MHGETNRGAKIVLIGIGSYGHALAEKIRNKSIAHLSIRSIAGSNSFSLDGLVLEEGIIFLILDVADEDGLHVAIGISRKTKSSSCLVIAFTEWLAAPLKAMEHLRDTVNALILLSKWQSLPSRQEFVVKGMPDLLVNAIKYISDTICVPGKLVVDYEDIREALLQSPGYGFIAEGVSIGRLSGEEASIKSMESLRSLGIKLNDATGVLAGVCAAGFPGIAEVNQGVSQIEFELNEETAITLV